MATKIINSSLEYLEKSRSMKTICTLLILFICSYCTTLERVET